MQDGSGRANVEDTPELGAYYRELEAVGAGALWSVANDIEPWFPQSKSVPVLWKYRDMRPLVLRAADLVTPEKASRRVVMLVNPGRRDVSACVGSLYTGIQIMLPGEAASPAGGGRAQRGTGRGGIIGGTAPTGRCGAGRARAGARPGMAF